MDLSEITALVNRSPLMPSTEEREDWIAYVLPALNDSELATAKEILLKAEAAEQNFEQEKLKILQTKYEKLKDILRSAHMAQSQAIEDDSRQNEAAELDKIEAEIAKL
ncbi:MAG: hypothetical protein V2A63_00625 [Patescibacteria group bacterium]